MTKNKTRNNTNKNFHSSGLRQKVDQMMDILYAGGVNNPMDSIEQISYLLFLRLLTERDEQLAALSKKYKQIFSGKWARYAWGNFVTLTGDQLFDSTRSAIENLHELPDLSDTGRLLFRRATLKIYDRPTLRAVIQSIHEMDLIEHDGADIKGDMYEYLLSKISMSGTNGQFRTPRHIIDFIVEIVDPKPGRRICDPACGTAGFLISAFNHILKQNTSKADLKTGNVTGDKLKPAQWKFLEQQAFTGFDNDANMIKIAILNLYLHKLEKANIDLHNPLTTTRGGTYPGPQYDCILANPPFSGKVQKESILSDLNHGINTRATELLFLKWFIEHLADKGRAGLIVPEGIIFKSQNAYKKLRKMLVDDYLWCVLSLPAGVFNPYSGVKTSILLMDKMLSKKTDKILFVKIENDGFDLGAQRKPIDGSNLPAVLEYIRQYQKELLADYVLEDTDIAHSVEKEKIAETGDYNLSGDRYKTFEHQKSDWPMVELGKVCLQILSGGTPSTKVPEYWNGKIPWITSADILDLKNANPRKYITKKAIKESATNLIPKSNIIVVTRVGLGKLFLNDFDVCISQDSQGLIINKEKVITEFLLYILFNKVQQFKKTSRGSTIQGVTKKQLNSLQIPLPPLDIQKEIVAEIDSYQKEINKYKEQIAQTEQKIKAKIADVWGCSTSQGTVKNKTDKMADSGLLIAEVAEHYKTDVSLACLVLQHFKERVKPIREFHLQKYVYIAQEYLKLPIVSEFQPMAAGPWSSAFKNYACACARQQQWFFLKGRNVEPGKALKAGTDEAEKILGHQREKVLQLLDDLKRFGDSGLERWATILMVVSQLKAARKAVTRWNIQEAIDNWSGKRNKEWFTKISVSKAIDGMNQKGWIKLIGE